jgi:hypothetical protein
MIVRIWRGWPRPEDAGDYADCILGTGIVESKATSGNHGAYLVSRPDGCVDDERRFAGISAVNV